MKEVDGVDHYALVAYVDTGREREPAAVARLCAAPERPYRADFAVTVIDRWQNRGAANCC